MALVVEDGTGVAGADAYVTTAYVDAYDTGYVGSSGTPSWATANAAAKEKAVRIATEYLDARYGTVWRGNKLKNTQGLDWPRDGAEDDDGFSLDDMVPEDLKRACAILSIKSAGGESFLPDVANPGMIESKSVTAGSVSVSKTFVSGMSQTKQFPKVEAMVSQLILAGDRIIRA